MEDRDYLLHIARAIGEIGEHTAGMSREAYEQDSKTQRAVERNLQIIGEAVRKLSPGFKSTRPGIEWDEIYATRNVVVHQYFGVDNSIVWDILLEDVPLRREVVRGALAECGDAPRA